MSILSGDCWSCGDLGEYQVDCCNAYLCSRCYDADTVSVTCQMGRCNNENLRCCKVCKIPKAYHQLQGTCDYIVCDTHFKTMTGYNSLDV